MATTVHIPKVGMTMEEGDLVRWVIADGATVEPGQIVFEMETEKVEIEVEAESAGRLKQLVAAGTRLKPGAIVGCLLGGSESEVPMAIVAQVAEQWSEVVNAHAALSRVEAPARPQTGLAQNTAGRTVSSPAARRLAREHDIDISQLGGTGPSGRITEQDVRARLDSGSVANNGATAAKTSARTISSPSARRLAREHHIDIGQLRGTGPRGRITEQDVNDRISAGDHAEGSASETTTTKVTPMVSEIPYTGRRRIIGERMHGSLRDSAQLTLMSEVPAEAAVALMTGLNAEWDGERLALLTPIIMKACALALREHPKLNARLGDDTITLEQQVNIGFATDLEGGLMVPVVRDVDTLELKELAIKANELSARARENTLNIDDVSGGTFTVSSLAKLPVDAFTPVLNPPQVAILGVGRIRDVVRFEGSRVVPGKATTLSLTFDHRVIDGAPAGRFLARVGELLNRPFMLM
jgi:pyruvate dehydrogenase E2 component (dihydrolipoamide acetyltransferase)